MDEVADVRTYDTTFQPVCPNQTAHVPPAIVAVPICWPTGWIEPCLLSQTMISAPVFWPSVRGVGSNQMSYAASHTPPDGNVIATDVRMPANVDVLACIG